MRRVLLSVVAFALASCSSSTGASTTTAVPSPQTTETTGSTTTVPRSTTSTVVTTTSIDRSEIDYPEDPTTVADLPDALTTYIGALVPDPELTITGPDDLDGWMAGWLEWFAWINANPSEGAVQLDMNMIAGSDQFDQIRSALIDRSASDQRLLGGSFLPVSLSGTFDDFFEDKTALRIVMIAGGPPSYLVDDTGKVVSVFEGLDGEVTVSALLRYVGERDAWIMETFEVLGRS